MGETRERQGWHWWHWLAWALVTYVLGFAGLLYDATHTGALRSPGPGFWSTVEIIYAPLIYLVERL